MAYILDADYNLQIQDVNLQQIINSNEAIRDQANLLAEAEMRSYLIQKYDIDAELLKTGLNRDPQILQITIDIALYHLHSRISQRNIPDIRVKRYDNAVQWLKMCVNGDLTPKLTVKPEKEGMRIRYGGNTKNINQY
jgi:phage gp36-like protein